ncbi:MAG: ABC transporter permease subunit [Chloroflexota bacterium]
MFVELKYTLHRLRGQIIGWGIGIALYGLMMAAFYSDLAEMGGLINELLSSYPKELIAFFGDTIWNLNTPEGYLDLYYFNYMTVIIGIFSVGVGAKLLSGDEEHGIMDLVLSYPLSRTRFFWSRFFGFIIATAAILIIGWLSWVIPSQNTGIPLTWMEFLLPFIPLFAELLVFASLALLLSMLLPSMRAAGWFSGCLLVANYLLIGLSNINADLQSVIKYTPLYYYQGGDAISGLNWEWLAGLLGVSIAFALLAWWRFQQRDIRVGGEGGWELTSVLGLLRLSSRSRKR